jgi:hypothetical protein
MEMDAIQREHPEYTLQERLREHTRRGAAVSFDVGYANFKYSVL